MRQLIRDESGKHAGQALLLLQEAMARVKSGLSWMQWPSVGSYMGPTTGVLLPQRSISGAESQDEFVVS